jgi:hypothetical protein
MAHRSLRPMHYFNKSVPIDGVKRKPDNDLRIVRRGSWAGQVSLENPLAEVPQVIVIK